MKKEIPIDPQPPEGFRLWGPVQDGRALCIVLTIILLSLWATDVGAQVGPVPTVTATPFAPPAGPQATLTPFEPTPTNTFVPTPTNTRRPTATPVILPLRRFVYLPIVRK